MLIIRMGVRAIVVPPMQQALHIWIRIHLKRTPLKSGNGLRHQALIWLCLDRKDRLMSFKLEIDLKDYSFLLHCTKWKSKKLKRI